MTICRIFLAHPSHIIEFYSGKDLSGLAKSFRSSYTLCKTIECNFKGEDAAEEMFELTNNPSRQEERENLYGRQRSVSVGDIVEVDGVEYLCAPTGWIVLK